MSANAKSDPYGALRYPEFRNLTTATFLLTCAILIQEVVLGYQLYLITHDPLSLGLVGLAEAIPFISLALFGGHLADRREKRGLMRKALVAIIAGSLVLFFVSLPAVHSQISQLTMLLVIYGAIFVLGLARGIYSPTGSALKAFLVPREQYGNAATWSGTFWQAGAIVGPASAGFAYTYFGFSGSLAVVVLMLCGSFMLISRIAPRPVPVLASDAVPLSLRQSLREGIDYVWKTPIILYAISLDMFSVLFGGVLAILPIFATDILHVGAQGLGMLRASPGVGAMITLLLCAHFPPMRHAWRNLLWVVSGFGIATLVFAISSNFLLSAAMLFLTGAFDSVSVVIRGTILQIMPPDHLRGRVQSVNSIFLSSSNELGAFESGLSARLIGAVPSVLMGGAMTLVTVGWIWRRSKALFTMRLG